MKFKRPIYRILFFSAWIVVLGGIATLVIAANRKSSSRTCKGIAIAINDDKDGIFIKKEDVLKTIEKITKGSVVNKLSGSMNLGEMERSLEKNAWIRDAELYFDTKDVLQVSVGERQPVARVFNTSGNSFYIDSAGYQLPLLETYSVKLPVVTGFPASKKFSKRDSTVLQGLKEVIGVINGSTFWNAQVGQIDITKEGKFELIPVIGSHVVKLGDGKSAQQKLNNLMVFYKQVLHKAGLAKYSVLDVQFEGQVVAVKKGPTSIVDSIQLQKNIEELMKKKDAEQEPDDMAVATPMKTNQSVSANDSVAHEAPGQKPVPVKTPSNPIQPKITTAKSNPVKSPVQQNSENAKRPKAVMPSKAGNGY